MNRSLYSLILMDSVVEEVDKLAHRAGTNRSAFINQLLADYVSVMTPEKRIRTVFSQMEALLSHERFVPFPPQNPLTLAVKSSLPYKYRPSLRYQVELYRVPKAAAVGELTVCFRTQSRALADAIADFCRLWIGWSHRYATPLCNCPLHYTLTDLQFSEALVIPQGRELSPAELGEAISRRVTCFDTLLKAMLDGADPQTAEASYRAFLGAGGEAE